MGESVYTYSQETEEFFAAQVSLVREPACAENLIELSGGRLKDILQPIDDAFKKRWQAKAVVVIEINKDGEDDDGHNNKPLKHISQQEKPCREWPAVVSS